MTITEGTLLVKHLGGEDFRKYRYGDSYSDGIGTYNPPSEEMLAADGFMEPLTPVINPLTEAWVTGEYEVADGIISKKKRALTQEEIDQRAAADLEMEKQMMIVTPFQFKKALTRTGARRNQVNTLVSNPNTGDAILDQDIIDGWASAGDIRRTDPLILYAQAVLGWTELEADELFKLAATL